MSVEKLPEGSAVLRIEGELSIYRAAELKPLLLEAVGECPVLDLDLSSVTELDSAGVQLLLLSLSSAQARGHELRITQQSGAVAEVLRLLDLTGYFAPSPSPVTRENAP